MARSRNIKPGYFLNEILGTADPLLQLLFAGLWCLADREGRLEDRPMRIKAEIFPYREGLNVDFYLSELFRLGFLQRYVVDGKAYIQIMNFKKHQNPHHTEKNSTIPAPVQITVSPPLLDRGNPADSRFLIKDPLIPDHSSPSSPLFGKDVEADPKDNKMTRKEFSDLHYQTFGKFMPGGLNHECEVLCDKYPPDRIKEAFRVATVNGATSFNYIIKVLEGQYENGGHRGGAGNVGTKKSTVRHAGIDGRIKPPGYFGQGAPDRSDAWVEAKEQHGDPDVQDAPLANSM